MIEKALAEKDGAIFVYQPELFEKLTKHGVTIQDVLHVCRGWEVLRDVRRDGVSWRYKICGRNCDDKWMAVVLAVNNHSDVIAITGFRFSRGRRSMHVVCPHCGKKAKRSIIKRYHYKESGLDNVYLKNSAVRHQRACGRRFIEIPQIERLHDAIAYKVLNKKTIWRGQEFRFLRKGIGRTAEELGRVLGHVKRGTISRWENEKVPMTPATHHQMLLLVLRLKEEAMNERMDLEIAGTEILGMIVEKAKTPASITITPDTRKRLPFSVPKNVKASTRS